MLTQNIIITANFERQNRERIWQAAENSRLLQRSNFKETPSKEIPTWKSVFSFDWLKILRTRPAS